MYLQYRPWNDWQTGVIIRAMFGTYPEKLARCPLHTAKITECTHWVVLKKEHTKRASRLTFSRSQLASSFVGYKFVLVFNNYLFRELRNQRCH